MSDLPRGTVEQAMQGTHRPPEWYCYEPVPSDPTTRMRVEAHVVETTVDGLSVRYTLNAAVDEVEDGR